MTYKTFSILIGTFLFNFRLEVVAVSIEAAMADVKAAYGDMPLVQYSVI